MRQFFNYLSSGVSFLLLYGIAIFLTPILLILLGHSDFVSNPKIFDMSLYVITIEDNHFVSEATGLGALLSFLLGLLLYFLFRIIFKKDAQDVEYIK